MSGEQPRRPWGEEPPPPPPPSQYAPPGHSAPPAAGGTSGKATASLVLGICGIFVIPLICSILAVIFGRQARDEIDRSGGAIGGRGLAQAGIILGWVGIALVVAGLVVVALAVALVGWSDLSVVTGPF